MKIYYIWVGNTPRPHTIHAAISPDPKLLDELAIKQSKVSVVDAALIE